MSSASSCPPQTPSENTAQVSEHPVTASSRPSEPYLQPLTQGQMPWSRSSLHLCKALGVGRRADAPVPKHRDFIGSKTKTDQPTLAQLPQLPFATCRWPARETELRQRIHTGDSSSEVALHRIPCGRNLNVFPNLWAHGGPSKSSLCFLRKHDRSFIPSSLQSCLYACV